MARVAALFLVLLAATVPLSADTLAAELDVVTSLDLEKVQGAPPLIDFTLPNLAGTSLTLSSLKGKVVLLNFWATWCPPCRQEMPGFDKLYQSLRSDPDFVLLAVDSLEDAKTVRSFLDKNPYHFPVVLDTQGTATQTYSVRAYPTTYLIDRQGRVIGGIVGAREWDTPVTLADIRKLLALR
jgi:thiol-disulfide isomerase/thioredoxin